MEIKIYKMSEAGRRTISEARKRFCNTPEFIEKARQRFTGENSPVWKGGRTRDKGYVLLRAEGHPRARKNGQYVFEHTLVMENHLGRYLEPNEVVHHRNEIKDDNRIENLELMTRSSHMMHHEPQVRGKIITCKECGRRKPMDSAKFHCCRWCYLRNHLGYGGVCAGCNIDKKFKDIKRKLCGPCVALADTGKPWEPWNKGKPFSEEVRQKMSAARMGKTPWNKGRPAPEHVRKNLIVFTKGQTAWNKGVSPSAETKSKISKSLTGRKANPETVKKRAIALMGKIPWNKGLRSEALKNNA